MTSWSAWACTLDLEHNCGGKPPGEDPKWWFDGMGCMQDDCEGVMHYLTDEEFNDRFEAEKDRYEKWADKNTSAFDSPHKAAIRAMKAEYERWQRDLDDETTTRNKLLRDAVECIEGLQDMQAMPSPTFDGWTDELLKRFRELIDAK